MLQAISVVGGVLLVAAAIWLWRRLKAKLPGCPPPLGIVLLLKEPKPINAEILAFHFGQITGRPFKAIAPESTQTQGEGDSPAKDIVIGIPPNFLATADGTMFLINCVPKPYFSEPARLSEDMRELRIKTAVENHRAWLSAEILHPEAVSPENYRIVGRLLAGLIGPECVALYHPESNRLVPADLDQTIEQLRSDDPIGAVFGTSPHVPVILIEDDPRLKAAEAEARRRFPEFEAAFRLGRAVDFSVKASLDPERAPSTSGYRLRKSPRIRFSGPWVTTRWRCPTIDLAPRSRWRRLRSKTGYSGTVTKPSGCSRCP